MCSFCGKDLGICDAIVDVIPLASAHMAVCHKHPMAALREEIERMRKALELIAHPGCWITIDVDDRCNGEIWAESESARSVAQIALNPPKPSEAT